MTGVMRKPAARLAREREQHDHQHGHLDDRTGHGGRDG